MKSYTYKKLDAFTSGNSLGNPAAYIDLGNDSISDNDMLEIAKEHKGFVSEFIFVTRIKNEIKLTYYSSECEVSFCGHGTIATMYELIKNDKQLLGLSEFKFLTNKKGELTVYNRISSENAVFISAPEAIYFGSKIQIKEIAKNLGIDESIITDQYPIDVIDAGLRTLIIPMKDLENEISIYPSQEELKAFCIANQIDIVLIFSKETLNDACLAHTRVFAPKFGYLEDPATGSGNSAFGYYLLKNKIWNGEMISIEQGGNKMIFNEVKLLVNNGNILFGGMASKKIDGVYYLD